MLVTLTKNVRFTNSCRIVLYKPFLIPNYYNGWSQHQNVHSQAGKNKAKKKKISMEAMPRILYLATMAKYKITKKFLVEGSKVLIPVHIFTSIFWLFVFTAFYLRGYDLLELIETLNLQDSLLKYMSASNLGHFTLVLFLFRIITPFRYLCTLVITIYIKQRRRRQRIVEQIIQEHEARYLARQKELHPERYEDTVTESKNNQKTPAAPPPKKKLTRAEKKQARAEKQAQAKETRQVRFYRLRWFFRLLRRKKSND